MAKERVQLIKDTVDGRLVLRAPGVGTFTAALRQGRLVRGGDRAGALETVGVSQTLVVPQGVTGRIESKPPERVHEPVSYGDVLYELSPLGSVVTEQGEDDEEAGIGGPVLRAPYSGRFWHRPAPGDPAFISEGDPVESGMTVGLLEVMKTFTHLAYPDDGSLPSPAKVVRIFVADGEEVGAGDPVLEIEPA